MGNEILVKPVLDAKMVALSRLVAGQANKKKKKTKAKSFSNPHQSKKSFYGGSTHYVPTNSKKPPPTQLRATSFFNRPNSHIYFSV